MYGVQAFRANGLRFSFLDRTTPDKVGPILESYLREAANHGRLASLVVFERPGIVQPMEDYRSKFWSLLDGLAKIDRSPWPANIPTAIDSAEWEFSFAGEPIFVVCNTPAHVARQSRRSTGFVVTFQPRWVFEGITNTAMAAHAAFSAVRKRLETYDTLPPSPALGRYGEETVREFAQYFLDDENRVAPSPMARLSTSRIGEAPGEMATETEYERS